MAIFGAMTAQMLGVGEAARVLGVSRATVRRYVARGVLPAVQYAPKANLRFRERDLQALIEGDGNGAPANGGQSTHADGGAAVSFRPSAAAHPTTYQGGNE